MSDQQKVCSISPLFTFLSYFDVTSVCIKFDRVCLPYKNFYLEQINNFVFGICIRTSEKDSRVKNLKV